MPEPSFKDLPTLAKHLRGELDKPYKKFVLLYAYNGTGKTRLSTAFKDLGKNGDERDTLYFNAFTEDLFQWDNDLKNDRERVLKINKDSRFFEGLDQMEMDNRIRRLLDRYADFDFRIDTTEWEVTFSREVTTGDGENARTTKVDDIKVSRGEENIFIWCFFLAIVQLVLDRDENDDETGPYRWVKYLCVDDPISSLDEGRRRDGDHLAAWRALPGRRRGAHPPQAARRRTHRHRYRAAGESVLFDGHSGLHSGVEEVQEVGRRAVYQRGR